MKLRNRLSLAVTAVSASVMLCSFVTVYLLVRRDETRDLDHALLAQAHAFAQLAAAKSPGHPAVIEGVAEIPETLHPTQRYIAIYADNGELVSATQNFGGETPRFGDLGASAPIPMEGVATDVTVRGARLRGVTIPLGHLGDALLYAASRHFVDEDERFLHRTLAALFVAATLATALFSRWLGERLARDVQAVAGTAREVSKGNLTARVGAIVAGSAETRALAADLDHMIEQLGALVAAQRTFVSHAAHELRSPLSTMRGELQLALRRPREAVEYRRTIEDVLADVEALAHLAEDLLTLARVQAWAPGGETALIGEVLSDALRMARGPAEARSIVLEEAKENGACTAVRVQGTRGELSRALRNLIDNAVAQSPAGAKVSVAIALRGGRFEIAVTDRGPGVAPEDAPHLFEPFYRGLRDLSGERPGAGLGLAIVRGIARSCGGDVWFDRTYEGGARFILALPGDAASCAAP